MQKSSQFMPALDEDEEYYDESSTPNNNSGEFCAVKPLYTPEPSANNRRSTQ